MAGPPSCAALPDAPALSLLLVVLLSSWPWRHSRMVDREPAVSRGPGHSLACAWVSETWVRADCVSGATPRRSQHHGYEGQGGHPEHDHGQLHRIVPGQSVFGGNACRHRYHRISRVSEG